MDILESDFNNKREEWPNETIEDYLVSIKSWVEDMDGYYDNTNSKPPENIDWEFIALLFYVGKIYE